MMINPYTFQELYENDSMENLKKLQDLKRIRNSHKPELRWQYVINQYNEKEIALAKKMAEELDCAVLLLSQLSGDPDLREYDHRPRLSDLKGYCGLEQDVDVIIF